MATPTTYIWTGTRDEAVAYYGYSWTTMLFGPAPAALFRGDWPGAFIGLLAVIGNFVLAGGLPVVTGIWAAFYNGYHRKQLMVHGAQEVADAGTYEAHARAVDTRDQILSNPDMSEEEFMDIARRYQEGRQRLGD